MQMSEFASDIQQELRAMTRHRYITYLQLLEDLQKLDGDELLSPVIVMDHNNNVETIEFLMYGEDNFIDELPFQPALML